jgi:capsular exopolysaccharide synthesis family protein
MPPNSVSVIDFYSLESPFATEFRRLLHRLRTLDKEQELKSVLVTSASLSEGKSTVCGLLAVTAARKGLKTLLVDTDLRRPTLHTLVGAKRAPGVAEILTGGSTAKDVLQKTRLENLDIVTAGGYLREPAEVFDAPAIGRFLTEFKFYYDLILVDCAPLIPVSDPMLLSSEVDGTLMVVRAGQTAKEVAQRAAEIMRTSGSRVCGAVVNNVNNRLPNYYDYTYYAYQYQPGPPDNSTPTVNPRKAGVSDTPASGESERSSNTGPAAGKNQR